MSTEDEELQENEYPLAIKIFKFLRWAMVVCAVMTFVGGIVLLFKGYPWYFVLPGYIVINFFFRVMRTYFRNILEELEEEYAELGEQTF